MNLTKDHRLLLSSSLSVFLVGCGSPNYSQSDMHITIEEAKTTQQVKPEKIPALVKASPTAPVLSNTEGSSTFDVVVTSVPVRDLLFALARDAGVNMDIDDEVGGFVSISALDQTLDAILARIAEQVDIRVEYVGDAMVIKPDLPYYKYYQVDFLNIERDYTSSASTTGVGGSGLAQISNSGGSNLWSGIRAALEQILEVEIAAEGLGAAVIERTLRGEEKEGSEDVANSELKTAGENTYSLNEDTGVLVVYAPDSLQKEVQSLLDRNIAIAKRQVLLEATIVEVVLNNQYSQGIDWSLFNSLATEGLALYQGGVAGGAAAALEYITNEVALEFGEIDFNAAAYINSSDDEIDNYSQLSDAQKTNIKSYSVGSSGRGNALALALRDAYVADSVAGLNPSGLSRIVSQELIYDSEFDEDSGLFTYTGGANFELEEFNPLATSATSGGLSPNNPQENFFSGAYRNGDISAAIQLLDTFGDAKILSSPRISALNHQPAILRVVDQEVYFTFEVEEEINEDTGIVTSRGYQATENIVDIGFAMNVFPHISDDDNIILNLKPTVTRILDYRSAPILDTFGGGAAATNVVPITRVRELESVISLRDGEIAVLGGLLEDRTGDDSSSVPGLSSLPGVGGLFENTSQSTFKTEFVVFIRAKIIDNPSVNGDYSDYRHLLPNADFIVRDTETTILPPAQLKAR